MPSVQCPFCGTSLSISTTRCRRCYESVRLYLPDAEPPSSDRTSSIRTRSLKRRSALGRVMLLVGLGAPILAVALFFLLV